MIVSRLLDDVDSYNSILKVGCLAACMFQQEERVEYYDIKNNFFLFFIFAHCYLIFLIMYNFQFVSMDINVEELMKVMYSKVGLSGVSRGLYHRILNACLDQGKYLHIEIHEIKCRGDWG